MTAAVRLLVVSDVIGATQTVNFSRPFAKSIHSGAALLELVSARDLPPRGNTDLPLLWRRLRPTALILSRYASGGHEALFQLARSDGIPIIYHLDDDLFAVPETLGPTKHQYYNAPARLAHLRAAVQGSYLVYTSTPELARRLTQHGITQPILAGEIACAMDPRLLPRRTLRRHPVIGYMASAGHGRDLELAKPGILKALAAFPDATFELFGSLQPPEDLVGRLGSRLTHHAPVASYDAFLEQLATLGWWVGLAPLESSAFNACKTEIKWLEYSFAGLPTLASNIGVYRSCCADGAGLIVPDDTCWGEAISGLLASSLIREDLVQHARAKLAHSYSVERLRLQVEAVVEAARDAMPGRARPSATKAAPKANPPGPRPKEYDRWINQFDRVNDADLQRIDGIMAAMGSSAPRFTVALVWPDSAQVEQSDVRSTIESLLAQYYPNWEVLAPPTLWKHVESTDKRIRRTGADDNLGEILAGASGGYIAFVAAGDRLAAHALMSVVLEVCRASTAPAFLYTDEDDIDESGQRSNPKFKGEWDFDLFLAQDYAARLAVIPSATAKTFAAGEPGMCSVYSLLLKAAADTNADKPRHIPLVLYHRRGRAIGRDDQAYVEAVEGFLAHSTIHSSVQVKPCSVGRRLLWPVPIPEPLVSLVIPTRDRLELLRGCIDGLLQRTNYPSFELLVVDNDSERIESLTYFLDSQSDPRVRVFYAPGPFNYSALNNFGVRQSHGHIVGLLNNDLEVIEPDWLSELVSHAIRPDVGAVGPLLYYADRTVQHAGVALGIGGTASHLFKHQPAESTGYMDRLSFAQELSAVTGACLIVRRHVWDQVGGLDEDLPVAFNDVDFCLRARKAGYRNIWTPYARLLHLESATRGTDQERGNRRRFERDSRIMSERWGAALLNDPFFSPNLSLQSVEGRPAFPPRVVWPWWDRIGLRMALSDQDISCETLLA